MKECDSNSFTSSKRRSSKQLIALVILLVAIPVLLSVYSVPVYHTGLDFLYFVSGTVESVVIKLDKMGIGKSKIPADKHVVIVGAGYAGSTLGVDLLSRTANFTIIDSREAFHHNIATARALVQPAVAKQTLLKYAGTFSGRFMQGRITDVDLKTNSLTLASGKTIQYDALVIATGTAGDFPSKLQHEETVQEGLEKYHELYEKVKASQNVAVIGGGGAGVELAAEIKSEFSEKNVTLFHSRTTLVSEHTTPEFQNALRGIMDRLNVSLVMGERVSNLADLPHEAGPATVITAAGTSVEVDLVLKCTGMKVNTDPFQSSLGDAINDKGQLRVNQYLQVEGHNNVFAIGDCCDTNDFKFARSALKHSKLMAENLANMYTGKPLKPYNPGELGFYNIALALGPNSGLGMNKNGGLKSESAVTREKSRDVFVSRFWKIMGQSPPQL